MDEKLNSKIEEKEKNSIKNIQTHLAVTKSLLSAVLRFLFHTLHKQLDDDSNATRRERV